MDQNNAIFFELSNCFNFLAGLARNEKGFGFDVLGMQLISFASGVYANV